MRKVDRLNLKVKALLAAAVTGAGMLVLLQYLALPRLEREVSPAQRIWLRYVFMTHTGWFLVAIVALTAIVALPVLFVALWMV